MKGWAMSLKTKVVATLVAGTLAVPLALSGSSMAIADEADGATLSEEVPAVTPETIELAKDQLQDNGYAFEVVDGHQVYEFEDGMELSLPVEVADHAAEEADKGIVSPMVGGGILDGSSGVYIDLSNVDQQALLAGGGGVLGGVICLVTAALCPITGGLIAAAAVYINNYGLCPGTLRIEADWNGVLQRGYCI